MNSLQLKIVACLFMVIDHCAVFASPFIALPMHWIGRLAAPVFVYLCVWSCKYTRNIWKYVFSLYCASVIMIAVDALINSTSNVFNMLFQIALVIAIFSLSKVIYRVFLLLFYIVWQVLSSLLVISILPVWGDAAQYVLSIVLGNLVDGGYFWVLFGVALFYCRGNDVVVSMCVMTFSIIAFFTQNLGFELMSLVGQNSPVIGVVQTFGYFGHWGPLVSNQWMMVFSCPLLCLYNNERGLYSKFVFYFFYPIHLIIIHAFMVMYNVSLGA
ncbi:MULTISPECIES: TraX family protein [unclassified Bifidobacterium]|uniref:TraX family protein n=1 Tax=unclassified Bifidobacterium TaxID=2608897 RepID=UPI00112A2AE7|nr:MULTISPECIES: TraX family protein [unclassified Bifidobacterium]